MSKDDKSTGLKKFLTWRNALILLGIVTLVVGIYFLTRKKPLPEGLIQVNGRIEGDVILISSKYNGKIKHLFAREGDNVQQNQIVVTLDDPETRARPGSGTARFECRHCAGESSRSKCRLNFRKRQFQY